MSDFAMNQLYIQSKIIFYSLTSILMFILLIYIFYIIYSSLRSNDSQNKEDISLNNILDVIYDDKCIDNATIKQTLNRLYSEKHYYQKLYITFFNYSIIIVNLFLGFFVTIYTKFLPLNDYMFSFSMIASLILYFIYVYMNNISVQIANQSIAIEYLEHKIGINIQKFSHNGHYKSSSNILTDYSILQYIVVIFACTWIFVEVLTSANKNDMCGNLILSIAALFIFPAILLGEKRAKTKKKSMIEEIKNKK